MRRTILSWLFALGLIALIMLIAIGIGLVAGIGIAIGSAVLLLPWPARRPALPAHGKADLQ
jgi:hypothetical protein